MDESEAIRSAAEAERIARAREGFNEFFDWHMRGRIEYSTA